MHFAVEIEAHRVVRLIFNGQLLNQDSTTLGQYGLFDNCVVHCHVSQPHPPTAETRHGAIASSQSTQGNDLDLSELLVSIILILSF